MQQYGGYYMEQIFQNQIDWGELQAKILEKYHKDINNMTIVQIEYYINKLKEKEMEIKV